MRVQFAGEATTKYHPSTIHGAYLTGIREASRLDLTFDQQVSHPNPPHPHPHPLQNLLILRSARRRGGHRSTKKTECTRARFGSGGSTFRLREWRRKLRERGGLRGLRLRLRLRVGVEVEVGVGVGVRVRKQLKLNHVRSGNSTKSVWTLSSARGLPTRPLPEQSAKFATSQGQGGQSLSFGILTRTRARSTSSMDMSWGC